jgi:hypothetical protein
MAGHRQARGAPRRDQARQQRMRHRYETELDASCKLGWAFDWLRSELAHLARARVPDGAGHADTLAREAAAAIVRYAEQAYAKGNSQ